MAWNTPPILKIARRCCSTAHLLGLAQRNLGYFGNGHPGQLPFRAIHRAVAERGRNGCSAQAIGTESHFRGRFLVRGPTRDWIQVANLERPPEDFMFQDKAYGLDALTPATGEHAKTARRKLRTKGRLSSS